MAKPFDIRNMFQTLNSHCNASYALSMFYVLHSRGVKCEVFTCQTDYKGTFSTRISESMASLSILYIVYSVNFTGKSSNLKLSDSGYSMFTVHITILYFPFYWSFQCILNALTKQMNSQDKKINFYFKWYSIHLNILWIFNRLLFFFAPRGWSQRSERYSGIGIGSDSLCNTWHNNMFRKIGSSQSHEVRSFQFNHFCI